MHLSIYLRALPVKEKAKTIEKLSKKLGVGRGAINHWCNGTRKIRPVLALKLESLTNGQVTRYELRPDIYPPPRGEEDNTGMGKKKLRED